MQKVEAVRALAGELVRPLSQLRAVILQASANPDEVAVFLFENGRLRGPAGFSTLGMRIQNEQSGSTSLFAQPMAIEPVVEEAGNRERGLGVSRSGEGECKAGAGAGLEVGVPSARKGGARNAGGADGGGAGLADRFCGDAVGDCAAGTFGAAQALVLPAGGERTGEIFFPDAEGQWPVKAILRGRGPCSGKRMLRT